jgi:4-amino-4-deoxy-L-arabinose transferase-like glycosyltransferase
MARRRTIYLGALIALSIALWIPRLQGPLDLRYDAGVYYVLGTSLAEGRGYRLLSEPGEIQAVQYPPLLPALVAVHQRLAGTSDPAVAGHWLRITYAVLFLAYILAVYFLATRFLPAGFGFLAALITLLHVHTNWMSDLLFTEIPFALATMLFLLASSSGGRLRTGSAGVLATASYLLRSIGIAALVAWVAESFLRRNPRQLIVRAAVCLVPVIGWQLYIGQVQASPEYAHPTYAYQRAPYQYYNVSYLENIRYVDPFAPELGTVSAGTMAARIARALVLMPASLGEAVSSRAEWSESQIKRLNTEVLTTPIPVWIVQVPLVLLGVLSLMGLVLLAQAGEWLIPMYVLGSIALVGLTPWPGQFERYLAPLTPILALALLLALLVLRTRLSTTSRLWARRLGVVTLVTVLVGVLGQESFAIYKVYTKQHREVGYLDGRGRPHEQRLFFYTQAWRTHDAALDWLRQIVRPEDVIATSTPHWAYLKTGSHAVLPPFEADVRAARRLLEGVPVRYLVVDSLEFVDVSRRYAAPVARAYPREWQLIYSSADSSSRIYRRADVAAVATKVVPALGIK